MVACNTISKWDGFFFKYSCNTIPKWNTCWLKIVSNSISKWNICEYSRDSIYNKIVCWFIIMAILFPSEAFIDRNCRTVNICWLKSDETVFPIKRFAAYRYSLVKDSLGNKLFKLLYYLLDKHSRWWLKIAVA